jgi:hypothetical protein
MSFNVQRPLTEDVIAMRYAEGRGTGVGAEYKPWITEADLPAKKAHKTRGFCSLTNRRTINLSDVETHVRYYYETAPGVTDIREQFPLDREITRRIARELGIQHPRDPKSKTDIVMTTDLLVDYLPLEGPPQLLPRSVKEEKSFGNFNDAEHGEIERRYWGLKGHQWKLVTNAPPYMPTPLKENLERFRQWRFPPEHEANEGSFAALCDRLLTELSNYEGDEKLGVFGKRIGQKFSLKPGEAINTLFHLIYTKQLAADIIHTPLLDISIQEVRLERHGSDEYANRIAA